MRLIETAPKDGTCLIGWCSKSKYLPAHYTLMYWSEQSHNEVAYPNGSWITETNVQPDYWEYLPESPKND